MVRVLEGVNYSVVIRGASLKELGRARRSGCRRGIRLVSGADGKHLCCGVKI